MGGAGGGGGGGQWGNFTARPDDGVAACRPVGVQREAECSGCGCGP